ncbi:uncharacterized protein LOC114915045 [Cajanus cajan]|uniref:uncharacterized protein LOC114915045 n=1 Tax=Cajanus cajan TaxID=3821 RepID=UPI0010FAE931|nr:uncharacterized protein LOC114915045 [Cajanus cajan]
MDSSGSRSRCSDKEKEEDEREMLEMVEQRRGFVQAWSLRPLNQPSLRHRLAMAHHVEQQKIAQYERQKMAQLELRARATRDQGDKDPHPMSQEMVKDGTTNAEEPSSNAPHQETTRNAKEEEEDDDYDGDGDNDDDAQQKNKNPPNE